MSPQRVFKLNPASSWSWETPQRATWKESWAPEVLEAFSLANMTYYMCWSRCENYNGVQFNFKISIWILKRYDMYMTTLIGLHLMIIWGCQKVWLKCWLCEMKAIVEKAAFENTMEEAFSASHCPNCEEFRRFRDFSQGRPAVNLSEVGRRGGGREAQEG